MVFLTCPLQALQQHGGDLQVDGLHQAGLSTEHRQVVSFFNMVFR